MNAWGPYFWGTLHLACLSAQDVQAVQALVESYTKLLPCPACRDHFTEILQEYPIPDNLETLFMWSVNIHNVVNASIGKPIMNYDDALHSWTGLRVRFPIEMVVAFLIIIALLLR
jgi:hypothetical protein